MVVRHSTSNRQTSLDLLRISQNGVKRGKIVSAWEVEISHCESVVVNTTASLMPVQDIFLRHDELKNRLIKACDRLGQASEAHSRKGSPDREGLQGRFLREGCGDNRGPALSGLYPSRLRPRIAGADVKPERAPALQPQPRAGPQQERLKIKLFMVDYFCPSPFFLDLSP